MLFLRQLLRSGCRGRPLLSGCGSSVLRSQSPLCIYHQALGSGEEDSRHAWQYLELLFSFLVRTVLYSHLRKCSVLYTHCCCWWPTLDSRSILQFWPRQLSTNHGHRVQPTNTAVPAGREEHSRGEPGPSLKGCPGWPLCGQLAMPSAEGWLTTFGCQFCTVIPVPECLCFQDGTLRITHA